MIKRESLVTTEEKLLFDILHELREIKQTIKQQGQVLEPKLEPKIKPQEALRPMAKGTKPNAGRKGQKPKKEVV